MIASSTPPKPPYAKSPPLRLHNTLLVHVHQPVHLHNHPLHPNSTPPRLRHIPPTKIAFHPHLNLPPNNPAQPPQHPTNALPPPHQPNVQRTPIR
ncbi:hypothetical protein BN946_scf184382.g1 [Trametes cinnabarina]|uniref:Uncharacterized protein n=1 Tax=Pycnoporus cinnabarinus TaxID=5643 RepID=A0A060S8M9_PYCCI|nr:hypothetical protein BN946_scf184382.g1 [Trametes cinnabarina]